MRYCVFTLVSAMLAAAIGCQAPLQHGGYGGYGGCSEYGDYEGHGKFDGLGKNIGGGRMLDRVRMRPAVGPGAVPAWFESGMNDADMFGMGAPASQMTSQVHFLGPDGVVINYDVSSHGMFDSEPLICPATHNFSQGAVYRLKLSNIPSMVGRDLYPTIEIAPTFARTQAFLAHNMIPIEFTDNDFDQVAAGNFITKVVYLPNPEFQSIATAGVGTLVNTQLEPGVDPIVEAENRGAILAIIRIGNKDLSMDAMQVVENTNGNANFVSANDPYAAQSLITAQQIQPIPSAPELSMRPLAPRATTVRPTPLIAPPQPSVMQ